MLHLAALGKLALVGGGAYGAYYLYKKMHGAGPSPSPSPVPQPTPQPGAPPNSPAPASVTPADQADPSTMSQAQAAQAVSDITNSGGLASSDLGNVASGSDTAALVSSAGDVVSADSADSSVTDALVSLL